LDDVACAFGGTTVDLVIDPEESPPVPPDTFDLIEIQLYISKLIQWSLEASRHEEVGRIWLSATCSERGNTQITVHSRPVDRDIVWTKLIEKEEL
jgi:hypothetical protein